MSDVIITVRGEHEKRVAPEEGVVRATVRARGPQRGPVVERLAALAEPLRTDLTARTADGSVREWSSEHVAVWVDHPTNNEGQQLPPIHHASVDITATFTDLTALSWWVSDAASKDGIQINGVTWRLTHKTRTATEAAVAAEAVSVAVARAAAYATAIGRATIEPVEIADLGLLSGGGGSGPHPVGARAMMFASAESSGGLELQPQDIVITAAVEARFAAH